MTSGPYLSLRVTELAPASTQPTPTLDVYADIVRPFGHIVAIDDARQDLYPLKSKSITWH